MAALYSGSMMSLSCLFTILVCLLQICSGEFNRHFYKVLLDGVYSASVACSTFADRSKFHCLKSCNLDEECKGVFFDGRICSMVRHGTSIHQALTPAPLARFYMKSECIFLVQSNLYRKLCGTFASHKVVFQHLFIGIKSTVSLIVKSGIHRIYRTAWSSDI